MLTNKFWEEYDKYVKEEFSYLTKFAANAVSDLKSQVDSLDKLKESDLEDWYREYPEVYALGDFYSPENAWDKYPEAWVHNSSYIDLEKNYPEIFKEVEKISANSFEDKSDAWDIFLDTYEGFYKPKGISEDTDGMIDENVDSYTESAIKWVNKVVKEWNKLLKEIQTIRTQERKEITEIKYEKEGAMMTYDEYKAIRSVKVKGIMDNIVNWLVGTTEDEKHQDIRIDKINKIQDSFSEFAGDFHDIGNDLEQSYTDIAHWIADLDKSLQSIDKGIWKDASLEEAFNEMVENYIVDVLLPTEQQVLHYRTQVYNSFVDFQKALESLKKQYIVQSKKSFDPQGYVTAKQIVLEKHKTQMISIKEHYPAEDYYDAVENWAKDFVERMSDTDFEDVESANPSFESRRDQGWRILWSGSSSDITEEEIEEIVKDVIKDMGKQYKNGTHRVSYDDRDDSIVAGFSVVLPRIQLEIDGYANK